MKTIGLVLPVDAKAPAEPKPAKAAAKAPAKAAAKAPAKDSPAKGEG